MKKVINAIAVLLLVFQGLTSFAQISHGGVPPTVEARIVNNDFPDLILETPDFHSLLSEDEFTDKHGIAPRFAVSIPAVIDFAEEGKWMRLRDGSSVCRMSITAPEAQALIMYYKVFDIPKGGRLFLYNENKTKVIGAFTNSSNPKRGAFATEMIPGETTIFEYHTPARYGETPRIIIEEVGFVYRSVGGGRGFGDSGICEVNVNCPEGWEWYNQARGITRIIVKQGGSSVWCSGSLVNNSRLDGTPFLLTADHCGPNATSAQYDQWIFYFRYQSDTCVDPLSDSTFRGFSMIGCSKIAAAGGSGVESDFKLVLLNEWIPQEYEPFFNGWSAVDEPSDFGVTIHHPQGDIKKISTYTSALISTNWGNMPNTHWRVIWAATETNWGVTEGGSSGSPIFNTDGLIVGQLTGGDASCTNQSAPDYYGKFSHSWEAIGTSDSTKLKPWLDPDDTGVTQLGGYTSTLQKVNVSAAFSVFPNPATGSTFVDLGELGNEAVNIYLTDISGRIILSKHIIAESGRLVELDLSKYSGGVYFVQIESNGLLQTLKLIRQP